MIKFCNQEKGDIVFLDEAEIERIEPFMKLLKELGVTGEPNMATRYMMFGQKCATAAFALDEVLSEIENWREEFLEPMGEEGYDSYIFSTTDFIELTVARDILDRILGQSSRASETVATLDRRSTES